MKRIILLLIITFIFAITGQTVYSHSFAIEKVPAQSSVLSESPEEISITFDKEVDQDLAQIQIYDENNQSVTENLAVVTNNRLSIKLSLPELQNGIYRVEFYVISSNDGHPIQGSYHFKVKKPDQIVQSEDRPNIKPQPLIDDKTIKLTTIPEMEQQDEYTWSTLFHFLIRFVYFSGLIMIVGWVLWRIMLPTPPGEINQKFLFWGIIFQMIHLLGLIAMILIQLNMFADFGLSVHTDFPFGSSFGLLWFGSLLLSMLGFICLFKHKWFDSIFVFVLVFAKSLNGHAAETDVVLVSVFSNSIHLAAGSVWAAGLAMLVLFNRKYRTYAKAFLPQFSNAALWSICIVSVSGIVSLVVFDPSWSSAWTLWLILKVCAVVGVVLIGGMIRQKLKIGPVWNLVKVDFCISLLIILIVSIFTYLSPHF